MSEIRKPIEQGENSDKATMERMQRLIGNDLGKPKPNLFKRVFGKSRQGTGEVQSLYQIKTFGKK